MDSYAFKNPWDQLGMHHVLLQVYLPQQWQQVMVVYLQETDRLLATCIWIYILPIKTNLGLSEVVGSPSTNISDILQRRRNLLDEMAPVNIDDFLEQFDHSFGSNRSSSLSVWRNIISPSPAGVGTSSSNKIGQDRSTDFDLDALSQLTSPPRTITTTTAPGVPSRGGGRGRRRMRLATTSGASRSRSNRKRLEPLAITHGVTQGSILSPMLSGL